MKRLLFIAAIVALFASCEKEGVPHTGDVSGNLYAVWTLKTKTVVTQTNNGPETVDADYTNNHFYVAFGEFPFPHAIAKKGSFTNFDLSDVDVDAVRFTFNADQRQISFLSRLWLSDDVLTKNMILDGTFDVLELTDQKFVIRQKNSLLKTTTTYSYIKYK